jgi:hypothetical protein
MNTKIALVHEQAFFITASMLLLQHGDQMETKLIVVYQTFFQILYF